jgi:hypothetical protein
VPAGPLTCPEVSAAVAAPVRRRRSLVRSVPVERECFDDRPPHSQANPKSGTATRSLVPTAQVATCPGPTSAPGALCSCTRPRWGGRAGERVEPVQPHVTEAAIADVPGQHPLAVVVRGRLSEGAGAGNGAAADVEPVAHQAPLPNLGHVDLPGRRRPDPRSGSRMRRGQYPPPTPAPAPSPPCRSRVCRPRESARRRAVPPRRERGAAPCGTGRNQAGSCGRTRTRSWRPGPSGPGLRRLRVVQPCGSARASCSATASASCSATAGRRR